LGIHVYFKEPIENKQIDIEGVIGHLESMIPTHLLDEIEMIVFGMFDEFKERSLNAMYKDGTLYVSNIQDDHNDLLDDLIHETSHSLESRYGFQIYGDGELEKEFLRKREYLHDILWKTGFRTPKSFFTDLEYNEEFDMFLYKQVGYGKLIDLTSGLFINPYAATSINEYFATGFTDFYMDPSHGFLKKLSPVLYRKLILLQDEKNLDNL
tara:strand:- start:13726 stop:14355 length:630 start_codon:yes stop_codon:yes gene_type:complete